MTFLIRGRLVPDAQLPYFAAFEHRQPPSFPAVPPPRETAWHLLAGATIGLGLWYLHWRWTETLNPDALLFSVVVATIETLIFLGTLLFFHDIWREQDTPRQPAPGCRAEIGLPGDGPVRVDVLITTYDEGADIVLPTIAAARALDVPRGIALRIYLLDDGDRPAMADLAMAQGVTYLRRTGNVGFKAGNLTNALLQTSGDLLVICDADTRLLPGFVANTSGYFRDPMIAWVQTPHWFYDIPEGVSWQDRLGRRRRLLAGPLRWLTGSDRTGEDPFLSDPALFFDVIQRRRNRNGASFCCGAASIHRREPLFEAALRRQSDDIARLSVRLDCSLSAMRVLRRVCRLQPFRFHVSEDIYTSIILHTNAATGWRSVYHPQVESRMLSPWSMQAWATQKLKYAGGTFDILLHDNPLFRRGMPWRIKLHYAATFWSYLTVLWVPVLLLAPVITLFTGIAPMQASPLAFFLHLLPLLVINEAAIVAGCKGHYGGPGRIVSLMALPIQWRALVFVLRGRRPAFPVTPKIPGLGRSLRYIWPNLVFMGVMAAAAVWGVTALALDAPSHDASVVSINLFWMAWNALALGQVIRAALWQPPPAMAHFAPEAATAQHDSGAKLGHSISPGLWKMS